MIVGLLSAFGLRSCPPQNRVVRCWQVRFQWELFFFLDIPKCAVAKHIHKLLENDANPGSQLKRIICCLTRNLCCCCLSQLTLILEASWNKRPSILWFRAQSSWHLSCMLTGICHLCFIDTFLWWCAYSIWPLIRKRRTSFLPDWYVSSSMFYLFQVIPIL